FCLFATEGKRRSILSWLAGQDLDENDSKALGLPISWTVGDENGTEIATGQQREDIALRAIQSIGVLSLYHQPLILAFDQLEGLRDEPRLTRRWGDVLREIFTMAPNMLVVTCIFPSLWDSWFLPNLDESVTQRVAQTKIHLERL